MNSISFCFFLSLFTLLISCETPPSSLNSEEKDQLGIIDPNGPTTSLDSIRKSLDTIKDNGLKQTLTLNLLERSYFSRDSQQFHYWHAKTLEIATIRKDTFSMAESHRLKANFMYRKNQYDSSYHHYNQALNLYNLINNDFFSGKVLLNMATIQRNVKDYLGSEVTTTKAIELLKPLDKKKQLYLAYNNLGIIYNELEVYDEALKYHKEALKYQKALNDNILKASSLNNLGVVHQRKGDFHLAIDNYQEALAQDSIPQKNPRLYAMLRDNIGYSLLKLGDTLSSKKWLEEALLIRDSINHKAGIVINKIHLGEYYLAIEDTAKAVQFLTEAKNLSHDSKNHRDLLHSLLLLGKIDHSRSKDHLLAHISLNDSLQKRERAVRNKFARIRFETDEFIAENQHLTREKNLIFGGSMVSVAVLLMGFIILFQRHRNKQLLLEQAQQKSNEEIYNLLLVQHEKLEEGRNREKKRISQELHDGILGKIFGIRFMLNSLYDKTDEKSVESKKKYLEDLKGIEEEIRSISHDLNTEFLSSQVSFVKIVDEFLEDQKIASGIDYMLENDQVIKWEGIKSKIKINLFRIIQEATHNTIKHSQASMINISFSMPKMSSIQISIEDNGKGFDQEKTTGGIGIKNIKSRVRSLNGSLNIESSRKGTNIRINIPIH